LGGPALVGGVVGRTFPILSAPCGNPTSARAYSLKLTALPRVPLGILSTWPSGLTQPLVSTLNGPHSTIDANAVIVPAGTGGSIDVFVTDNADLVVDVNGYFAPGSSGGLYFYNVTPCRVYDSRLPFSPSGADAPPIIGLMNVQ